MCVSCVCIGVLLLYARLDTVCEVSMNPRKLHSN